MKRTTAPFRAGQTVYVTGMRLEAHIVACHETTATVHVHQWGALRVYPFAKIAARPSRTNIGDRVTFVYDEWPLEGVVALGRQVKVTGGHPAWHGAILDLAHCRGVVKA